jgi:hypothetical protein
MGCESAASFSSIYTLGYTPCGNLDLAMGLLRRISVLGVGVCAVSE